MDIEDFFNLELKILEKSFSSGVLSKEQFERYTFELKQDCYEQQYVRDMNDAGRGYLLR